MSSKCSSFCADLSPDLDECFAAEIDRQVDPSLRCFCV